MIPVNEPDISKRSIDYVIDTLKTGWISSSGKYVPQFEEEFANYVGAKYGIMVTSGTAAMHIALLALGIGPGDEVIVPAFTMAATWLTVIYTGATPVFVDCERQTYNIDPGLIEKRITKNTKAIMPVHIYGHPAEMDEIMRIAKKYKLYVIEDAAEAHGAEYKGRKCGSFGDFGCFSFYGNKIVTSGEGGMAVTKNKKLAERVRWYKDFCFSPKKRFIHEDIGYNYRATNMQAAFGLGSLQSIKHSIKKKLKMATLYKKYLGGIEGLTLPTTKPYVTNVYWMYAVLVDPKEFGLAKNNLRRELLEKGVDTRDFFYPPEVQPAFKKYVKEGEKFPNTKYISERGFYLPSGLAITDVQIKKVGEAISEIYKTAKK